MLQNYKQFQNDHFAESVVYLSKFCDNFSKLMDAKSLIEHAGVLEL